MYEQLTSALRLCKTLYDLGRMSSVAEFWTGVECDNLSDVHLKLILSFPCGVVLVLVVVSQFVLCEMQISLWSALFPFTIQCYQNCLQHSDYNSFDYCTVH